jgi:hypothetical protein
VTIVFLASGIERLLEDALRFLLRSDENLPDTVKERRALFEKKTRQTIPGIFRRSGLNRFDDDWRELRRLRNQVAHGNFSLDRTMKASVLRDLRRDAVPAFEQLMRVSLTTQEKRSNTISLGSRPNRG